MRSSRYKEESNILKTLSTEISLQICTDSVINFRFVSILSFPTGAAVTCPMQYVSSGSTLAMEWWVHYTDWLAILLFNVYSHRFCKSAAKRSRRMCASWKSWTSVVVIRRLCIDGGGQVHVEWWAHPCTVSDSKRWTWDHGGAGD